MSWTRTFLYLSAMIGLVTVTLIVSPCSAMGQNSVASHAMMPSDSMTTDTVGVASLPPTPQAVRHASADSSFSEHWITRREMIGAGVSVLATIAAAPLDKPVAGELQEPRWQKNEALQRTSQALAFGGGPGPFFLGAGFFAVGKITGSTMLSSTGAHVTESVLLAAGLTALGKGIAGRALPGVKTAEQFEWARGFHRRNGPFVSFPSGHTAAAFAMASALTGEAAYWRPGLQRYVGPASYITATAIGLSRLYQNVHWTSDLPLAIAIGTWSGLTVENRAHKGHKSRVIDRIVTSATIARAPDGRTIVGWTVPFIVPSAK